MFPKSIGNQSGMVPGPSGHQKTSFLDGFQAARPLKKNSKNDKLKKSKKKNHQKLKHLTTFWTLFSQISHADA